VHGGPLSLLEFPSSPCGIPRAAASSPASPAAIVPDLAPDSRPDGPCITTEHPPLLESAPNLPYAVAMNPWAVSQPPIRMQSGPAAGMVSGPAESERGPSIDLNGFVIGS